MTISLLIDNDVVVKLAQMDIYSEALAVLGVKPEQVASFPLMLRYMGRTDAKRRLQLTANSGEADRLGVALQSIVEIEMSPAEAKLAARAAKASLEAGLDIQEGELTLFTVAICRAGLDVFTGDKRAIRDLPAFEALWEALSALRERIVCLEQVFGRVCKLHGWNRTRTAIQTAPNADTTLTFVYEQTRRGGQEDFLKGLQLVIREHVESPAPGWLKSLG